MPSKRENYRGKRILMLVENCTYEADERVRHEVATLVAAGYGVTVIARSENDQPWREVVNGVPVYRFSCAHIASSPIGYVWEYAYSLTSIFVLSLIVFMREGFDILHIAHPPDAFVFIAAFYKLFGRRYVLDHHDLSPELYLYARFHRKGSDLIFRALLWLEKLSFHLADHVISTNRSYRDIAVQRGCVDERRVSIVRNGPDLHELCSLEKEESLCQPGRALIGYVGAIGIQDGVDSLLRALHHVVKDLHRTNVLCVILGDGTAMPALKRLTKELNLEPYVLYTGWVSGPAVVARYLNTVDVCVAPEPSDPYNDRSTAAKVMEYMAMGKPVVCFDLPEHRFSAGAAALYARPGDEVDFARRIACLIDDPTLRAELGRVGLWRIGTELAWEHQGKRLVAAYARLVAASRSPGARILAM